MFLFLPTSHPDTDIIRRAPGTRVVSSEAAMPALFRDMGDGAFRAFLPGEGANKPPIPGTLFKVDVEYFENHFSYPYLFDVPLVPPALATLPSY